MTLKILSKEELTKGFPTEVAKSLDADDLYALNVNSALKRIIADRTFESHKKLERYLGEATGYSAHWSYPLSDKHLLVSTGSFKHVMIVCIKGICKYYEKEKL
jgi:hypothetical protein